MKKAGLILLLYLFSCLGGLGQALNFQSPGLILRGMVIDASTLAPLPDAQIFVNRTFAAVTDTSGAFSFVVNRSDTIRFSLLGYKTATLYLSDTLSGKEFIAGIYLKADTLSISEVIIVPKMPDIRSGILNTPPPDNPEFENARYNLRVAAYQGKMATGRLGDPSSNYNALRQQVLIDASEKGGIPSGRMVGINPLVVLPFAYMLLRGGPGKPLPVKADLTRDEIDLIYKKYLESTRKKE